MTIIVPQEQYSEDSAGEILEEWVSITEGVKMEEASRGFKQKIPWQ